MPGNFSDLPLSNLQMPTEKRGIWLHREESGHWGLAASFLSVEETGDLVTQAWGAGHRALAEL